LSFVEFPQPVASNMETVLQTTVAGKKSAVFFGLLLILFTSSEETVPCPFPAAHGTSRRLLVENS
jgi:hypothetical protein